MENLAVRFLTAAFHTTLWKVYPTQRSIGPDGRLTLPLHFCYLKTKKKRLWRLLHTGSVMSNIKSFLGKQIDQDTAIVGKEIVVQSCHSMEDLSAMTKKEVIEYAHKYAILINSRKKKDELIEIILRN